MIKELSKEEALKIKNWCERQTKKSGGTCVLTERKNKMKETIKTIMDWHEKTFPDATLDGQIRKYQEELHEWEESQYEDISELADMFIVACGIARFDLAQGLIYMADLYDQFVGNDSIGVDEVMSKVERKMEKNRKRVWNKTGNGTYHHENGIED